MGLLDGFRGGSMLIRRMLALMGAGGGGAEGPQRSDMEEGRCGAFRRKIAGTGIVFMGQRAG